MVLSGLSQVMAAEAEGKANDPRNQEPQSLINSPHVFKKLTPDQMNEIKGGTWDRANRLYKVLRDKTISEPGPFSSFSCRFSSRDLLIAVPADRYTYATKLLESGAELVDIQALLGHVNLATTQIYTHVSEDRMAGVVGRL
jgi:integrase